MIPKQDGAETGGLIKKVTLRFSPELAEAVQAEAHAQHMSADEYLAILALADTESARQSNKPKKHPTANENETRY